MDERADALSPTATPTTPDEHEARIREVRDELATSIDELKRRVRNARNIRLQVARHPRVFALAAAGVLALTAAALTSMVRRRRRSARFDRFVRALLVLQRHPERLAAATPSVSRRVAAAGLSALATSAAHHLATRTFDKRAT